MEIIRGNSFEAYAVSEGLRQFEHSEAVRGNGIPEISGRHYGHVVSGRHFGTDGIRMRNVANGIAGSKLSTDDVIGGLVHFWLGDGLTRY